MDNILFDHGRNSRIGLPEAVFCQGKTIEAVRSLVREFDLNKNPILFTRLAKEVYATFSDEEKNALDYDELSRTAFTACLPKKEKGSVAIVSAGTADAYVSHEVSRTLHYLGISYTLFEDNGVAGLWRLTSNLDKINAHDVVVVVAGLDAALASVLGGLTMRPLLAVPTSIGYGVATGGDSALSSMLCSCAPGVGVFNIDNGYGAACAAVRILNAIYR